VRRGSGRTGKIVGIFCININNLIIFLGVFSREGETLPPPVPWFLLSSIEATQQKGTEE
jgi:hypothetical protein